MIIRNPAIVGSGKFPDTGYNDLSGIEEPEGLDPLHHIKAYVVTVVGFNETSVTRLWLSVDQVMGLVSYFEANYLDYTVTEASEDWEMDCA